MWRERERGDTGAYSFFFFFGAFSFLCQRAKNSSSSISKLLHVPCRKRKFPIEKELISKEYAVASKWNRFLFGIKKQSKVPNPLQSNTLTQPFYYQTQLWLTFTTATSINAYFHVLPFTSFSLLPTKSQTLKSLLKYINHIIMLSRQLEHNSTLCLNSTLWHYWT